jgi:hypothetical protein
MEKIVNTKNIPLGDKVPYAREIYRYFYFEN